MADFPYNTSYKREYVVVSKTNGQVVLRPKCSTPAEEEALFESYWQEFCGGEIIPVGLKSVQLHISSVPTQVRRLSANAPYDLEYPRVVFTGGDVEVDVSKYLTANKPDTQTPGLYKIEYVLPIPDVGHNVIWCSYISVEEPPVLRHIITPWNRDNYTIATLNRLVIEPQFQEALYEEGAPFYNFVTSNVSPALRPGTARECFGCIGYKVDKQLFISGHKLPLATAVELDLGPGDSFTVHLDRIVTTSSWYVGAYSKGSIVQHNHRIYYASVNTTASDIPGSSNKWLAGQLYSLQEAVPPKGITPESPDYESTIYYRWTQARSGEVELLAVWAPVDLRGYVFSVDVLHAPQLGTYWGYYDKKYFKDYRPGDLVSYISEGVMYLYRRNGTDIQDLSTEEAFRPGNFRNPHWDEVYAQWEESQLRKLGRWIRPISNAGNALIAKTCSLSEEICTTFAYILGIPDSLVDAIGSKCSVFLYVLLQRTRNTYEGFRSAFRAVGLDVSDLHRVYPTVSVAGEDGHDFEAVYPAEEVLKQVSVALRYDMLWQKSTDPSPADLQYAHDCSREAYPDGDKELYWVRYADPDHAGHGQCAIQEFRSGEWVTVYKVTGFGDDKQAADANSRIKGNNRYYRASLSLLDRLATQALINLGGERWIQLNAFTEVSSWVTDLISYEVPIYIYLVLSARVASLDKAWEAGYGMRRVHYAVYGGTPTLVVHPTRYFDLAACVTREFLVPIELKEGNDWVDVEPTLMRNGSAVYDFDKAVTIRFKPNESYDIDGYWTSRHTLGSFGDNGAVPRDASIMGPAEELQLANGMVGVTPLVPASPLTGEYSYLGYNYIFSDDGVPWTLDETTEFGGYSDVQPLKLFATWIGSLATFVGAITKVVGGNGKPLRFTKALGTKAELKLFGSYPEEIYIYGERDNLIAMAWVPEGFPHKGDPDEVKDTDETVRIYIGME